MSDQVFDLDAVAAEAQGKPLRFKYAGREWTIKHISAFDWRITKDGISGDMEAVALIFRKGMGEEQYAEWEKVDQPAELVGVLFDQWLKHCGLSRGKSPDSTDSSESTGQPSKPASKRPTKSASRASSTGRSRRAASSSS
jgi:hypothetical protein